jgi:oligoribonuclease NrnB/cAMP/cGMP phosphodiesterase (DHH superfamily)
MNTPKTVAIYHKDCTDGTTAAAIVLRKYPDALVIPLSHGFEQEEINAVLKQINQGDQVFTVDCVIGVKELLAAGHKVTSLDHHAGAYEEYLQLAKENPAFTYIFDNKKSGSSLSWSYFFPNEEVPELVKLVEDADLWNWKYGDDTKFINNYLFMYMNQPLETLNFMKSSLDQIKRDGAVIARYSDIIINHDTVHTAPVMVKVGDYTVPFYNVTNNKSAAGNILTKVAEKAVGLFTIDGPILKISFRSLDGQSPSSLDIAKVLGGGGHRNSSGAAMKLETFLTSIVA